MPVADGETLTVPDGSLTVAGSLAVLHDGTDVLVSGVAFPGEEYRQRVRDDLTGSRSVAVDIDLGLEPERYREELVELVRSVE